MKYSSSPHSGNFGDLVKTHVAMQIVGYADKGSFWKLVYSQAIPHIRYNQRVIKFSRAALYDWLRKRSSG